VTRQTVHRWLRRYAADGIAGLVDGSAKPLSCPHQMPPEVEARIVELRRLNPGWGPRTCEATPARRSELDFLVSSERTRDASRHGLPRQPAQRATRPDASGERDGVVALDRAHITGRACDKPRAGHRSASVAVGRLVGEVSRMTTGRDEQEPPAPNRECVQFAGSGLHARNSRFLGPTTGRLEVAR